MAIKTIDNFDYFAQKPLDSRLAYSTVATMKSQVDTSLYDGCIAYVSENDKYYKFLSSNTVDVTTGKWREYSGGGGGGGTYTAGTGIDITNDVISTKQSQAGDIDEIVDIYPAAGELVSIVNAFNNGDIYSTNEKMIGQWVDNKPLYQKTLDCGALPNNTSKSIPIDVPNLGIITNMFGMAVSPNDMEFKPLTYVSGSSYDNYHGISFSIDALDNTPQIKIVTNVNRTNLNGYATIQYTKTTDSPVSVGSETEYSTTEKIVGTWIDGKPLYQKTVEITSPTTGAENIVLENIDHYNVVGTAIAQLPTSNIAEFYETSSAFFNIQWIKYSSTHATKPSKLGATVNCAGIATISKVTVTIQYTKTT